MQFTEKQLERYSRQIILSGFGSSGQEKLFKSNVLVCGAGGLGSLVLTYLATCGIGNIGIVDFDRVDISNLPRQIIHTEADLGIEKVVSAEKKIKKLNPEIKIKTYNEKLTEENIKKIFNDYEIIVDALDNFNDKFLLNDYSLKLDKKLIHAGAVGFEGQILTIIPHKSICLRCLFPDGAPLEERSCKNTGILPTCVGLISILQANEVLKLILGIGEPYTNRVLKFNALSGSFYELTINKICNCF